MFNNLHNQIAEGNVFVDPSLCGRLGSNEEMLRVRDRVLSLYRGDTSKRETS